MPPCVKRRECVREVFPVSRPGIACTARHRMHGIACTVIDGGSHLQRGLQSGVYTVDIDTGDIGSTDFGKIGSREKAFLFDQGRRTVEQFVRGERGKLYAVNAATLYVGRDQKMLLFVNALKGCEREMLFVDKDSHWLYLIFPAFLAAARRGVLIRFITSAGAADHHEVYRQRLLVGLGVPIIRASDIPFRGFLSDPTLTSGLAAVTHSRNSADAFDYESTRTYSAYSDPGVVEKLHSELAPYLQVHDGSQVVTRLAYSACSEAKLFDRLRSVPQYVDAKFSLGEVLLDESLHGVQTHVKEFKYLQIDWLIRDFKLQDIDLFMSQEVILAGDLRTIVTPPVGDSRAGLYVQESDNCNKGTHVRPIRRPMKKIPVEQRPEGFWLIGAYPG